MREPAIWLFGGGVVIGIIIGATVATFCGSPNTISTDTYWMQKADSLTTANAFLTIRFDSARAESIAHQQRAESLATVPRTIYIANATRLTSGAPLDSLGILFFADPFVAVPDTILDHHEP